MKKIIKLLTLFILIFASILWFQINKAEATEESSKLKILQKYDGLFIGKDVNINVLQVLDPASNSNLVRILDGFNGFSVSENKNNQKIYTSGVFKEDNITITIDVVSKDTFMSKNTILENNNQENQTTIENDKNFESITNGYYNMLILDFQDEYENPNNIFGENTTEVVNQIRAYINQGKSIFFTNDMLLDIEAKISTNNFIENAVQIYQLNGNNFYETSIGYGSHVLTNEDKLVDKESMTMYPFNLSLTKNDNSNDAWNQFHTYSYNNITYFAASHDSFGGFTSEEKELFINTIYQAFLSSNSGPIIEVITPKENEFALSKYKEVYIKLKVKNPGNSNSPNYFDGLTTSVKVNNETIKTTITKENGDWFIRGTYALKDDDKELHFLVEVTDSNGSKTTKEWTAKVEEIEDKFFLTKQQFYINSENENKIKALEAGYIQRNEEEPFGINYTVQAMYRFGDLTGTGYEEDNGKLNGNKGLTLEQPTLDVIIPNGIRVNSLEYSNIFTSNILKKIRYREEILKDYITYELDGNNEGEKFLNDKDYLIHVLTVPLLPEEVGVYVFDQSKLIFEADQNGNNPKLEKYEFKPKKLELRVVDGLSGINMPDKIKLIEGKEKVIPLNFLPSDFDNGKLIKDIRWEISNEKFVEITKKSPEYKDITLKGLKDGFTKIKMTVTDIFGNTAEKTIDVLVGDIGIEVTPNPILIGIGKDKEMDLTIITTPVDLPNSFYKVDIPEEENKNDEGKIIATFDKETNKLTGKNPGETKLIITSTLDDEVKLVVPICVYQITITPHEIELDINQSADVNIVVEPESLKNNITTIIDKISIAKFNSDGTKVMGVSEGSADLIVTLIKNQTTVVEKAKIIVTNSSLQEIKFTKPYYSLEPGEKKDLLELLIFNPSTMKKEKIDEIVKNLKVITSLGNKVKIYKDKHNYNKWTIEGLEVGTSLVTVEASKQPDGGKPKASAYFEVKIAPNSNNNSSTNGKW